MAKHDLAARVEEASAAVSRELECRPQAGIILGTGLGGLAERVEDARSMSYADIPFFPESTVETHAGRLLAGTLAGKDVVAMEGRFHYYEGYTLEQVTFPVRVMKALGAKALVVTNACGGMNPLHEPGDIILIDDHINLMGVNPLVGPNDESLGPRFPDMSEPYDQELLRLAEAVALEHNIRAHRGVYVGVTGPCLETRAEYRFLRGIGADVVGMSTVPEVIVAVHAKLRVLGMSVITDQCLPDALEPAKIETIVAVAGEAGPKLETLVSETLARANL